MCKGTVGNFAVLIVLKVVNERVEIQTLIKSCESRVQAVDFVSNVKCAHTLSIFNSSDYELSQGKELTTAMQDSIVYIP